MPHKCYVEPFVGMGGIFLRRPVAAHVEVINDINGDVVNLFRVIRRHHKPFMELLQWQLTSRAEFELLRALPPTGLTDLERAARFLYLQRTAFGGQMIGRFFGVSTSNPASFDVTKLAARLDYAHKRLACVVIECLPFGKVIEMYDRPYTLFYFDPPYYGCEGDYGAGIFSPADFEVLARQLRGIKGKFLLSLNDKPEVRAIFAGFDIQPLAVNYSINGRQQRPAGELLISNFTVPRRPS